MASFSIFIFSILFGLSKSGNTGYAKTSFSGADVDITIQIDGGTTAQIDICGPANVWFGVAFNTQTMSGDKYAIIVYGASTDIAEYTLNGYSKGTAVTTASDILLKGETTNNGVKCVELTRTTAPGITGIQDFPNTAFSTTPIVVNVIAAKGQGQQLDYTTATAMGGYGDSTLSYREGTVPTSAPTEDPTQQGQISGESADSNSAVCFSSDSWVLTYPDFEKKQIEDLQVYDVILTYDEVKDKFFWDELLVKLHFEEGEFLNDVKVGMREFILNNGERLYMTDSHLLYIGHSGLQRADQVKLGDKLKIYDGSYVDVIGINENVMKYPRNLITYNGNLVINGVAISTFTDTIWGESKYWGKSLRGIMKYGYSFNIWRYPAYYAAKLWNQYASLSFKDAVLRFYCDDETTEHDGDKRSHWFPSFFSSS